MLCAMIMFLDPIFGLG
ncbi:hypothetical protein, partial [Plasmodium yoelii yoelii]